MIKTFFGVKDNAPETKRATIKNKVPLVVVDELGKKRIEDEYRQRQAAIEENVQKRRAALFEEQLRKGKASAFARTGRCRRRGDIFKFQRNYINSARVSVNEKYSMINRARALGKTGKVLPEVEESYFAKLRQERIKLVVGG